MKNKRARIPMRLKVVLMSILTTFVAHGIFAEVKEGIIRDIEVVTAADKVHRLVLRIDTDGNRIPDHNLVFPSPYLDNLSKAIQRFAEKGMKVVFDDEGHLVLRSGNKDVDGFNTISIDGDNMITLFPNEATRFRFAAEAQRRIQARAQPQSAEERKIADLEAELQRLKQGR